MVRPGRGTLTLAVDNSAAAIIARAEAVRIAEAFLFASPKPLSAAALSARLPAGTAVESILAELERSYAGRGINLIRVDGKWTFRTAPDLAFALARDIPPPRALSRAGLEVLAIIAYHQPATRAEIEDIRGVSTSKGTLDVLLETGWIRMRGRRKAPGRPITFGTTAEFLRHFGLDAVTELPGLEELQGLGLVDPRVPAEFRVPVPSDSTALADDEEPLDPEAVSFGLVLNNED